MEQLNRGLLGLNLETFEQRTHACWCDKLQGMIMTDLILRKQLVDQASVSSLNVTDPLNKTGSSCWPSVEEQVTVDSPKEDKIALDSAKSTTKQSIVSKKKGTSTVWNWRA
jgi:hypothetical protein